MFQFPRYGQFSLAVVLSFSYLAGCVTERPLVAEGESVSRTIANTEAVSLSASQANVILQSKFNQLGLKDVSAEQMQLGVLLLQERVRRYGEESDKVNAFAKGYGITILTLRSLSLNSFSQLGLDNSQILANLAFFVDIESKVLTGQTSAQLQKLIRGPLFLLNILYVSKFAPQVHEYGYLSEALDQMLETQTPVEVLNVAVPFAVYMRAIRVANYPVTANEETAFIGFISQQIQNGMSPVAIGDYAIQSLILFRSIRLGYVPLTATYERDLAEVIAPMLAQNKSADQIVGELVNNVVLTCGTASSSEVKTAPIQENNKEIRKITFADVLNKLQPSRSVAQTKKKIVVNPRALKVLKAKKSLNADVSVLVQPRNAKFQTNKMKPNASYMVMVPNAPYDKMIQERMIADVRRMAPAVRVVKVLKQGFNVILVENLSARDLETLVRFGYEIAPNSKPVFQGLQSCNASQFSSDISPVSDSVRQIGAANMHSQGIRGQGIKIGIVDSGLDVRHPDFECSESQSGQCRIKAGTKVGSSPDPLVDNSGHGTHVTSIAAGKNGIAPAAQVLHYSLSSYYDVIEVLSSSIGVDKPKVLNMSFSFPEDRNSMMSQLIDQVVRDNDVSVSAAAGNCGLKRGSADNGECGYSDWDSQGFYNIVDQRNVVSSPGIAKRAIAVGVVDRNDNYGTTISIAGPTLDGTSLVKPDLVAPGKLICAAGVPGIEQAYGCGIYHVNRGGFFGWCDSEHAVLSGSSMSAPMVTGSIALLKQKFPSWNTDEIKSALRLSANNQTGNLSAYGIFERGVGRLDVFKASLITGYPPVVRIDKIEVQNSASGKSVALTGAVYDRDTAGRGLREFRISIGKGEKPTSFVPLKSFARSVGNLQTNEALMAISNIPSCYQGKYILKIEGEDGDGNVASDYVMVNL